MIFHRPNPILFCLSLFALFFAFAELKAQGGGFTFSCASWDRIEESPIYYLTGKPSKNESPEARLKRLKEVDTPEMTRSETYDFKAGQTISFYRKISNATGEMVLQEIASNKIPETWKAVLFVFFPGEQEGTYRLYPLRDEREFAPFGSYQFVNLSNESVSGFLDEKKIDLKPQKTSLIILKGEKPRPINFGVWTVENGQQKWLMRNTLTYRPTKYLIYFFYAATDAMGRKKLNSKGIVAFEPEESEAKTW